MKYPVKNPTPNRTNKAAFNKHKLRVIENTKRLLNRLTICHIYSPAKAGSTDPCRLTFEYNNPIHVGGSTAWALNNIRTRWEVLFGVICRNQQGEHYLIFDSFQAEKDCVADDMSDLLLNACKAIYQVAPKLHRLCPFWIAVPRCGRDDMAERIINLKKTIHHFEVLNTVATLFEMNVNKKVQDYHTGKKYDEIPYDYRQADVDLEMLYNGVEDFEDEIPLTEFDVKTAQITRTR